MTLGYQVEVNGSHSKEDTKEDQEVGVFDVFAMIPIWLDKIDNFIKESLIKGEHKREKVTEETTKQYKSTASNQNN